MFAFVKRGGCVTVLAQKHFRLSGARKASFWRLHSQRKVLKILMPYRTFRVVKIIMVVSFAICTLVFLLLPGDSQGGKTKKGPLVTEKVGSQSRFSLARKNIWWVSQF